MSFNTRLVLYQKTNGTKSVKETYVEQDLLALGQL